MRDKDSFRRLLVSLHRCKNWPAIKLTIERNLSDYTLSEQQRADLLLLQPIVSLDVLHVVTADLLGLKSEANGIKASLRQRVVA
jgi:hypothetical protein